MWEFDIYNLVTKEHNIIFGYSEKDAFRRHPSLDTEEWVVLQSTYID